jgi:hypothetical protein
MKGNVDPRSVVLIVALLVVTAFVLSFVRGLGWPAGAEEDTPAGNTPAIINTEVERRGRIDVRNATTRQGLAAAVTDRLRDAGFDVVYYGNAETVPDSSVIIDHIGDPDIARAVGDALGIERLRTAIDSTLYLDATVILGVDFELPGR